MRFIYSVFILFFVFFPESIFAQQKYTIDGHTLLLFTEVEGSLTLLYTKEDKHFRFFSKKGDEIIELKNSKSNGKYVEEYKTILQKQTEDAPVSVEKVKLSPRSLSKFFEEYNSLKNPEYAEERKLLQLQFRLGFFGGINNVFFSKNDENILHPIAGLDFELVDPSLKRHAVVLQVKQTFKVSDHDYSASELLFNYRFKFVSSSKFDAFVNLKFATISYWKETYEVIPANGPSPLSIGDSAFGTGAPFSFGVGADYKLGNGYITFGFNDIFGLNVTSSKEFPVHFSLGYKWIL